jgi:hypothetical protein
LDNLHPRRTRTSYWYDLGTFLGKIGQSSAQFGKKK